MVISVQMPKQGNTVEECLLVEWKVKEGDKVKVGAILCSIETDKAAFDVESTADGVVLKLIGKAGDLIPVLTDIAIIGTADETVGSAIAPAPAAKAKEDASFANAESSMPLPAFPTPVAAPNPTIARSSGAPLSPRARALVAKTGVDASGVAGTGTDGRITSRDVQAAIDSGSLPRLSPTAKAASTASSFAVPSRGSGIGGLVRARDIPAFGGSIAPTEVVPPEAASEIVPYKGIRKLIGDRMHESLASQAQLTMNASADAGGMLAIRKLVKDKGETMRLPKITLNDMICWVVAKTLPLFPDINAVFDIKCQQITRYASSHLAVAVDTPRGLMVPVIRDAHRLSLAAISQTVGGYAVDCRSGKINPDLLAGGTFTVTNLGSLGVESFTPVVNAPQVAILGVCSIREVPVPDGRGGVKFQSRIGLSLTINHQVVDGAPGARFLQAVAAGIEGIQGNLALMGMQ